MLILNRREHFLLPFFSISIEYVPTIDDYGYEFILLLIGKK